MQYVELPLVLRLFAIPRTARILDLGCGRGFCLAALRSQGFQNLFGADADADALAYSAAPKVARFCGDACALPVPPDSFDVIFDFGTSYHVARPDASLREIQRILRPGGRYIYETRLSQLLSHPVRSRGRMLPWAAAPQLVPDRHALMWASRRKH